MGVGASNDAINVIEALGAQKYTLTKVYVLESQNPCLNLNTVKRENIILSIMESIIADRMTVKKTSANAMTVKNTSVNGLVTG